jgi:nitronate monooxygenase
LTNSLALRQPIIGAPMAGGPSTPALAAAVGGAGGLGFLAGGYLTPHDFDQQLSTPYGVNLFLPSKATSDMRAIDAYAARLRPVAARLGTEVGVPRWDDDALADKLDVLARHRPALVSFTFGYPSIELCDRIRRETGAAVVATVTSLDEARLAAAHGADVLAVQGAEAGGHRGIFHDDPALAAGGPQHRLSELVDAVAAVTDLPMIAAGGIASGADIRSVLGRGAVAAAVGTALLCCPEAGTSSTYRRALLDAPFTQARYTRAFTGRPARALVNDFVRQHDEVAPAGYPEIHHLTRPIRQAAALAGDPGNLHLWAGAKWREVTEEPAGVLVTRLARELDNA